MSRQTETPDIWTKQAPKKQGYYWAYSREWTRPQIVEVEKQNGNHGPYVFYLPAQEYYSPLKDVTWWAGPIKIKAAPKVGKEFV